MTYTIKDKEALRSIPFWGVYRSRHYPKTVNVLAVEIEKPLRVEGYDTMEDGGYLCIMGSGNIAPMYKDGFNVAYERVAKIAGRCLFAE